jgi:hypothetical protein
METKIFKIVKIKNNKVIGFLVGKTTDDLGNRYLVYKTSLFNENVKTLMITEVTEKLYRIDVETQKA